MCAWFRSHAAKDAAGAWRSAAPGSGRENGATPITSPTIATRVLHLRAGYGTVFRAGRYLRCSSSVVEHSLGKGEVESSILSCSTIFPQHFQRLTKR